MEIMEGEKPFPEGILFHAFAGSKDLIKTLAAKGGYFSFAGNILNEHNTKMRESLPAVPSDRLLFETDSPDLVLPEKYQSYQKTRTDGRVRSEPADLQTIVKEAALLRGEKPDVLAETAWENSLKFFSPILRKK